MKKCTTCKKEKELTEFCRKTEQKDGRNTICKKCQAEYNKNKYLVVKDKWDWLF